MPINEKGNLSMKSGLTLLILGPSLANSDFKGKTQSKGFLQLLTTKNITE